MKYDLSKGHDNLEILFVEICGKKQKYTFTCLCCVPTEQKRDWKAGMIVELWESSRWGLWKGIFIVTGDFNIDLLREPKESTRRCKNLLHTFSLNLFIKVTRKNKTLIDHISSNMNNTLLHTDVLMTNEISDHDTSYGIFNIKRERYEPSYKHLRLKKTMLLISSYLRPPQYLALMILMIR